MDSTPILVTSLPDRSFDLAQAIRTAAKARNISVARLGVEIMQRHLGRQRLSLNEYFVYGAHRPGLQDAERDCFIGDSLGGRMCSMLGAQRDLSIAGVFRDKILGDLVLRSVGLPIPRIQALAGPPRSRLPYPVLSDPAAVVRFLDHDAQMPVFGKPIAESMSLGATSIVARPEEGRLLLGDGRNVSSRQFVEEVFRHFPKGYLFQDMLLPHPLTVPLTGPVLATARIVTLRVGGKVSLLYGGIKWPGKGSMVDGAASINSVEASVDLATGQVTRVQDPRRLGGNALDANPVTDALMIGQKVPGWEAALDLAIAAHEVFPDQKIVGGDIGLTPEGPVIVELNHRPGMSFYQKTTGRGLWNRDLAPRLTEALAEAGHRRATRQVTLPWAAMA
jgi:hypothetical protein